MRPEDDVVEGGDAVIADRFDLVRDCDSRIETPFGRVRQLGHILETRWHDHGGASGRGDSVYHGDGLAQSDPTALLIS